MSENNLEKRINKFFEDQGIGPFVTVHKDAEEAKLSIQRRDAAGSEEIAFGWCILQ